MKKFILAVSGIALVSSIAVLPASARAQNGGTTLNLTCAQTAVDKRETAIGSVWTTFSGSMTSALSTRASALHTAWGMTDASLRRPARKAAWDAYKASSRSAHDTLKTGRRAAWDTWRSDMQACHVPPVESQGQDGSGNIGL